MPMEELFEGFDRSVDRRSGEERRLKERGPFIKGCDWRKSEKDRRNFQERRDSWVRVNNY